MSSNVNDLIYRKFLWTLENVSKEKLLAHHADNPIRSPSFNMNLDDDVTQWYWDIFVKGGGVFLDLRYESGLDLEDDLFYGGYLASIGDIKISRTISTTSILFDMRHANNRNALIYSKSLEFINIDSLFDPSKRFVDSEARGKLMIKLQFYINRLNLSSHLIDKHYPQDKIYDFYKERFFCDFTIVSSDGVEFHIHRIILAKISPVFKAIFEAKSKTNKVILKDFDSSTMREVMKFCYGENCDEKLGAPMLMKLHNTASKYEIWGLAFVCRHFLKLRIDTKNVLEVFRYADKFDDLEGIVIECLAFIIGNYESLESSIEEKLEPRLIMKIVKELTKVTTADLATTL